MKTDEAINTQLLEENRAQSYPTLDHHRNCDCFNNDHCNDSNTVTTTRPHHACATHGAGSSPASSRPCSVRMNVAGRPPTHAPPAPAFCLSDSCTILPCGGRKSSGEIQTSPRGHLSTSHERQGGRLVN